MTRIAAIYVRVSTQEQASEGSYGLQAQETACRAYAHAHDLIVTQVYADVISGVREVRPEFGRLMADAARYTDVIVYAADRLAREVRAGYGLLASLRDAGLKVHSTTQGEMDADGELTGLTTGLHLVFAQHDRQRLVKRLQHAKVAKVAGNPLRGRDGQPLKPLDLYGWRKGEVDETERAWVQHIYARALDVGTHALARELDALGVKTRTGRPWISNKLRELLRNPTYRGEYQYGRLGGGVLASCPVPPLVSAELWHAAQRALDAREGRSRANPERREVFPLTGRIRCACGRAMSGVRRGQRTYYLCNRQLTPLHERRGADCPNTRAYRTELIHAPVQDALRALLVDDAALTRAARLPTPPPPDTARIQADWAQREERLEQAYLAGAYPPDVFAARLKDLQRQRDAALALTSKAPAPPAADLRALRARLTSALALPMPEQGAALGLTVTVNDVGELSVRLDPPPT